MLSDIDAKIAAEEKRLKDAGRQRSRAGQGRTANRSSIQLQRLREERAKIVGQSDDEIAEVILVERQNAPPIAEPTHPSDAEIATRRAEMLAETDGKIAPLKELLKQMPEQQRTTSSVAKKLASLEQERIRLTTMTDDAIATQIMGERRQAAAAVARAEQKAREDRQRAEQEAAREEARAAEARERAAAEEQRRRAELAGRLAAKFPNWDGPWKSCPICEGSGRDADAERAENNRRASVAGGQVAGTGGSRKIAGAVIACDVCAGTGLFPDSGR